MLSCAPNHFQAFEIHMRKPSFVVGLDGRYTRNIVSELGVAPDEYDHIAAEIDTSSMNLGAWTGPKEEVSAELLTGRETDNFVDEMRARGRLVTGLMRRVAEIQGKQRWGFKILGDLIYADVYAAVWPNATFVLLLRDPRDQAMSLLKLNEQRQSRQQQLFYRDYRDAARGWCETIREARGVLQASGLRWIETRYEDLVCDTDRELSRISSELNLDLSGARGFHKQDFVETRVSRLAHHENLRQAVNADSVGKWKRQMRNEDRAVFEEVAGDLMMQLGYEP